MRSADIVADARRTVEICTACRYCAGYCAVFDVMALRESPSDTALAALANLCHNCRRCYYACQYAPPHDFAINVPALFSAVRAQTYEDYAWPRPLRALFRGNALVIFVTVCVAIAIAFNLPWSVMVALAGATLSFSVLSLTLSLVAFWRACGGSVRGVDVPRALWTAMRDALTLRNLSGARRYAHHAVFYGFLLGCAASVAVNVELGILGGTSMIAGVAGLCLFKVTADRKPVASRLLGSEYAFLALMLLAPATGLTLLLFGATPALWTILPIHLGLVWALFLLLPYSKFVHGAYRAVALVRAAMALQANRQA